MNPCNFKTKLHNPHMGSVQYSLIVIQLELKQSSSYSLKSSILSIQYKLRTSPVFAKHNKNNTVNNMTRKCYKSFGENSTTIVIIEHD